MRRSTKWLYVCAAAAAPVVIPSSYALAATEAWWQGGTNPFLTANYFRYDDVAITGTPNVAPAAADVVNFGGGGIGTYDTGTETIVSKLRIGYNTAPPSTVSPPAGLIGAGTLTVSGIGTKISTTTGSGVNNAGLWVGNAQNGTLTIQNGANVTSNSAVAIGIGTSSTRTGTINVTTGGSLTVSASALVLATATGTGATAGVKGVLNVSGVDSVVSVAASNADFNMATHLQPATYTQSGGTVSIADVVEVGANNLNGSTQLSTSTGTSFSLSGGTFSNGLNSTGTLTSHFFLGRGGTTGATLNLSGTGTLNVAARFLMGGQQATGMVVNQSGGTLNTVLDVRVGDASTATSTANYNFSGGTINATTGMYVGRQGVAVFDQTGGVANLTGALTIGNRDNATATNSGLYKISAGELHVTAATAMTLATKGVGEFRVIGDDGLIDLNGNFAANSTVDGTSTLAYAFEEGDQLSLVDVSGTATFAAGSKVVFDTASALPTKASYDLFTATTLTDSGIAFTGPAGWSLQVVSGGNGQVLQAVHAGGTLYWDTDAANPGAGGATPTGNWNGTASNFTADATGSGGTTIPTTAANDDVVFTAGADGTGTYTVTVTGTQSAQSVQVPRGNVTFTGGKINTPTFDVSAGASAVVSSAVINVGSGSVAKNGAGALTLGAANTYTGGTTVNGGTLILANADATAGGAIEVKDGALAQAQAALPKAVTVTTLTTNASGKFDITNNSMVVKGMTDSAVRTQLQAGYNAGAWNGPTGIVSTSVTPETSVGYATQAQTGITDFKGVTGLAGTDVLVKFTYAGDANLDGKVDIGDLGLLAGAWQAASGKVWFDGDFTYDGAVDIGDLGLLSGNWQKGTAGNPNPPLMDFATAMAQFSAFDGVVVPEPASLSVLALGGLALGRRRRRVQS